MLPRERGMDGCPCHGRYNRINGRERKARRVAAESDGRGPRTAFEEGSEAFFPLLKYTDRVTNFVFLT